MRTKEYDLIVLGTGDAGQTVALTAAKEKMNTCKAFLIPGYMQQEMQPQGDYR